MQKKVLLKKKVFVKLCPNCFSSKINSHLGFTGEGYKCMICGFDNFSPIEFEKGKEPKIKKKFRKF